MLPGRWPIPFPSRPSSARSGRGAARAGRALLHPLPPRSSKRRVPACSVLSLPCHFPPAQWLCTLPPLHPSGSGHSSSPTRGPPSLSAPLSACLPRPLRLAPHDCYVDGCILRILREVLFLAGEAARLCGESPPLACQFVGSWRRLDVCVGRLSHARLARQRLRRPSRPSPPPPPPLPRPHRPRLFQPHLVDIFSCGPLLAAPVALPGEAEEFEGLPHAAGVWHECFT